MIVRNLPARLVLAAVGGTAVGLLLNLLGSIDGYPLYALSGLIAGLGVAALFQLYTRNISLSEVTLSVPQLSQLTFVVNHDARHTAWQLFVEVSTRVSTQPLGHDEGFLREALNSLYSLFGETRALLREAQPTRVPHRDDKTVEYLALTMLNRELRPFLAAWHPRLTRFEQSGATDEATWDDNTRFREDLEATRLRLLEFAASFARLAGVANPEALVDTA